MKTILITGGAGFIGSNFVRYLYFQKEFGSQSGEFPVAEHMGNSTISLPLYPTMPEEHVTIIVDTLKGLLKECV